MDWSEETTRSPFWAPYLARFDYTMKAMFQQIRYFRYKTTPPLQDRSDESVRKYLREVEQSRRILLKDRMKVYTLCWYPERILEFDEWASEVGVPKGRGPHGRRSFDKFCQHLLQQEDNPRNEISVSVVMLSGESFPITYNKAQGFPGIERALHALDPKQFPLNHVEVLHESQSWTFSIQPGDILPVFVHPMDPQHHHIHRKFSPDDRIELVFYPYFCCRSKKMIPYPHGHLDRGRVSQCHPDQSHTRVYFQHASYIRTYPHRVPPPHDVTLQWKSIEDLLTWINSVATWTFTSEAFEHLKG
jgi:hypothetical protein